MIVDAKAKTTSARLLRQVGLAQKPFIVPIPITRNPLHIAENLTATSLKLSPAELADTDIPFPKRDVHGD